MLEDPRDLYAQGWTTLTVWVPPSEREGLKTAASLSEALAEALTRRRLDFLVTRDGPAAQGGENIGAIEYRVDVSDALTTNSAHAARETSVYIRMQKVDQLLHDIMEYGGPVAAIAGQAHHEIHEACFEYVTRFGSDCQTDVSPHASYGVVNRRPGAPAAEETSPHPSALAAQTEQPGAGQSAPADAVREAYQARVGAWMAEVFATGGADIRTRIDRTVEELFELAQSLDYDPTRIAAIRNYVFNRPVGEPGQETGGVMVTLASLCCAAEIDMMMEAECELARIQQPEVKARILAKQASKNGLHTPLPTAGAARSAPSTDTPAQGGEEGGHGR